MANITFYNSNATDQQIIENNFEASETDYQLTCVSESLSLKNTTLDAAVISITPGTLVSAELIEQMPKLQLIACRGTIADGIDLHAAAAHDITITVLPHDDIEDVLETTADTISHYLEGNTINSIALPDQLMGRLLVTRHCESEWNALGKWTGTTDVHLSENGFRQAGQVGQAIEHIHIDFAYASLQIRTLETLEGILDGSKQVGVSFERSGDLNERDYGDYTGMNKWEVRDKVGEEVFNSIRRDWDYPITNGETLKLVFERTVPFYQSVILPKLRAGKTVLIVSHGNAIRALIKYMENISDEGVATVEMPFGTVLDYRVTDDGHSAKKSEIKIELTAPPA